MPCGVCITSIFESNKNNKVRVHILTNGFSQETTNKFEQTAKKYNQLIEIHKIDPSIIEHLHIGRWMSVMVYARLLFPRVVTNIDKLLYFDCDIIVVGDLQKLWDTSMDGYSCMGVPSINANDIRLLNRIECYDHTYVNSGVLLMDLNRWRTEDIGERCIKHAEGYPKGYPFHDQDAINVIISKNIGLLNFKYNVVIAKMHEDYSKLYLHKKMWQELSDARKNPVILHYVSAVKPWHKEYLDPIKSHFFDAKNSSFWSDVKLIHKYSGFKLIKHYVRNFSKLF